MATSQRFSSVSNSTSSSGFSSNNLENTAVHTNSDSNQHFSPNWATLSFLDDSNDELEDVEVTKVAKNAKSNTLNNFFDPVVGGRNSTRSSSSRSSAGSTGCSDQALESSPTNSLSPYAFDHEQDDNVLGQVMTNFHQMSLRGDSMGFNYTNPKQQQQKQLTTTTSNNSIIIAGLNNPASSQQKETSILQHSQTQNIYQQQLSLPTPQQQPPPPLMHQYSNQLGSRALVDSNQLGSRALVDSNQSGSRALVDSNQQQQSNQTQLMANLAALAGLAGPQSNPMWAPQSGPFQDNAGGLNNLMQNDKPAIMQIRCKFGSLGETERQFHSPHGFCMGPNEEIIVADTFNHRIQIFDKEGQFKFSFGVPGKDEGQLFYPRKIAVLRDSGYYVICDRGSERSRMQIFSPMGHFIRRIPIRFIDIVAGLAISREGYIVAVDSVTPTIFILHENGALVKYIECSEYMTEPSDIAIFGSEYYICDFKGHSIVVMHENGNFLRRIGCQPVTNFPNGIDISDAGDILVGDSHGNQFHVAVYDRRGDLVSQFQCPQVKVSRCCGLKITSEGYIVTLAKNNHHVLILNTLYVP